MQRALLTLLCVVGSSVSQTSNSNRQPTTTPVPILRQVNSVNDDGSYTFGFEAADGTFKLETRDVNGEVTGKYGYIDANGKRQEFEYNANKAVGFSPSSSLIPRAAEGLQQPAAAAPRQQIPAGTLVDGLDISLVGFSEDKDEDGFVDPLPTGRGTAARRLPAAQPRQRPQQQQQQQLNIANVRPQLPAATQFATGSNQQQFLNNNQQQFANNNQQQFLSNNQQQQRQPQLTFNSQFTVNPQQQQQQQQLLNNHQPVQARVPVLPRFQTNPQQQQQQFVPVPQQFAVPQQQNVQFAAGAQLPQRTAAGFQPLAPAAAQAAQRFFLPGQNFNNAFQQVQG